ncbi:MAG TPA: sugar-binding domain-containing protein [Candidatus Nanopelagicales bacterium]
MKPQDYQRLVEIARLYYEQDLTQAEIAKTVGVSRPVVSRMLSEARQRGIVRIEVRSPLDEDHELLGELVRTFGIRGGLIVPTGTADEAIDRSLMVSQAALYVQRLLVPEVRRLGIGWGETVRDVIAQVEQQDVQDEFTRSVCPVIGSAPSAMQWFQTNELTRILAEKLQADPYYLHAPAFPVSQGDRAMFTGTLEYRQVSDLWRQLDLVLLGIGTYPTVPDYATAARFGDRLKQQRAVGVLATYYFDARGTIIDSPHDYAVRIPLQDLRAARQVVVVTSGTRKAQAVHGGLMTGLISHLVTDEGTARELLRHHRALS